MLWVQHQKDKKKKNNKIKINDLSKVTKIYYNYIQFWKLIESISVLRRYSEMQKKAVNLTTEIETIQNKLARGKR